MKILTTILSSVTLITLITFSGTNTLLAQTSSSASKTVSQITSVKTVELAVDGMTCQKGCADGIDKKLKNVDGVVNSKTSLSTGKSVITYDESKVKVDELIAVIDKKGYKAKLADKN